VVGYDVSNSTQEVEQTRTVHVAEPAAIDSGNVTEGLASVDPEASYLDIDGANSAAGVGGTLGSTNTGTLTQGETVVIQLDTPLLFEDDRINIEIIDTATNSRVLDRNVRVQHPETFQFAPNAENGTGPDPPASNPDASPDTPDLGNGSTPDLPDNNPSNGVSTDPSDSDTGTTDPAPETDAPPDNVTVTTTDSNPERELKGFVNDPTCQCTIYNPDTDPDKAPPMVNGNGNYIATSNNIPGEHLRTGVPTGGQEFGNDAGGNGLTGVNDRIRRTLGGIGSNGGGTGGGNAGSSGGGSSGSSGGGGSCGGGSRPNGSTGAGGGHII
jgi:uncharacterized membrane protein YgcG